MINGLEQARSLPVNTNDSQTIPLGAETGEAERLMHEGNEKKDKKYVFFFEFLISS